MGDNSKYYPELLRSIISDTPLTFKTLLQEVIIGLENWKNYNNVTIMGVGNVNFSEMEIGRGVKIDFTCFDYLGCDFDVDLDRYPKHEIKIKKFDLIEDVHPRVEFNVKFENGATTELFLIVNFDFYAKLNQIRVVKYSMSSKRESYINTFSYLSIRCTEVYH